jgi:hypothetical protein
MMVMVKGIYSIETGFTAARLRTRKISLADPREISVPTCVAIREKHQLQSFKSHNLLDEGAAIEHSGSGCLNTAELDCFWVATNSFYDYEQSFQATLRREPRKGLNSGNSPNPPVSGTLNCVK